VVSVAQRRVDRRVRATNGTVCVLLRNRPPTPWLECDAEYRPPTLTALAMKGDEERIRTAGCDGYISRPIRYQEFLASIEAQLSA
jgi:CheY-like chemotaxis protein